MAFQQPSDNPIKHRFGDFGRDKIQVAKWRIQLRDAFNLSYLYQMAHDWFMEEGWTNGQGSRNDFDFPETYYVMRDNPRTGRETWVRWRLKKGADGVRTGLFEYWMDINWKLVGVKDAEIVWKGQKVTADRGELEMECEGHVIIDVDKALQKSFLGPFKKAYIHRLKNRAMAMHWKNVYGDAYRFRDMVMNYFKLETFGPEKEAGEFYLKRTLE